MNLTGNLTKNFSLLEFANNQTTDSVKGVITPEVIEHAQMMQELRDIYNKPIEVSSWYRTKEFNSRAGVEGSPNSAHLRGTATDCNNIRPSEYGQFTEWWKAICSAHGKIGGVNYYSWGMHFCSTEDDFGNKKFVVRDKR